MTCRIFQNLYYAALPHKNLNHCSKSVFSNYTDIELFIPGFSEFRNVRAIPVLERRQCYTLALGFEVIGLFKIIESSSSSRICRQGSFRDGIKTLSAFSSSIPSTEPLNSPCVLANMSTIIKSAFHILFDAMETKYDNFISA